MLTDRSSSLKYTLDGEYPLIRAEFHSSAQRLQEQLKTTMTKSDKNHVSLILFQHQSHIAVKIYFSQYLQMLLTDDILQAIDNQTCVALLY